VDVSQTHVDRFQPGTSFEQVVDLYEFDRQLRLEVLDGVERIEVALRTAVTYRFALVAGAFGHTEPSHFRRSFDHAEWLRRVEEEIARSHETFVRHYQMRYDGHPHLPLWMATEVMSFGALSKLFKYVVSGVQREVAEPFGVHHEVLASWMHMITVVRNICAHHARLWNRQLGVSPKLPARDPRWVVPSSDRLFAVLLILRHMLRALGEGDGWSLRIERLIEPIAMRGTNGRSMGLPDRWIEHPIWVGSPSKFP
jgi:abortive infection bacteriophage resistance protein